MRSPEQQFAFAKGLPISELAKVMQGQSDVVDMAIAQMVLREKTRANKIEQGLLSQQQAQEPKVAERDLMEAGVAALPADVDFEGAAEGGIVGYAAGDMVGPPKPSREAMAYRAEAANRAANPYPTKAAAAQAAAAQATPKGFLDYLKGAARFGLTRLLPAAELFSSTSTNTGEQEYLDTLRALVEMGYSEDDIATMPETMRREIVSGGSRHSAAPARDAEGNLAPVMGPNAPIQVGPTVDPDREENEIRRLRGGLDSLIPTPKALTAEDARKEREAAYTAMGVEKDPYAFAEEDYQKAKDELSVRKGKRGWEAGLEAGLAMMGGESPYALVNIGNAGKQALKSWSADMKEMDKLDRDLLKEKRALEMERNKYNKSQADADLTKVEKRQDKIDNINLKKAEMQVTLDVEAAKAAGLKDYRASEQDRELLQSAQKVAAEQVAEATKMKVVSSTERAKLISELTTQLYNDAKQRLKGGATGATTSAPPSGDTLKFDVKGNPVK